MVIYRVSNTSGKTAKMRFLALENVILFKNLKNCRKYWEELVFQVSFGVLHTMLYLFCNVPDLDILGRLKSGNPAFITF